MTAPAARIETSSDRLRGMICMLGAVGLFSIMDAIIKALAPSFGVMQIMLFRAIFAFIPIFILVWRNGGPAILKTHNLPGHFWRSLISIASFVGWIYTFGHMKLADAVAIGYSAPIFITALSVPLLGERVGPRRWTAVAVGFVGVMIMVRPDGDVFEGAAMVAIGATIAYALAMIFIRRLGRTENAVAMTFYLNSFMFVLGIAAIPFGWVTPTWPQLGLLAAMGLLGGFAQLLMTAAYRMAPVSIIAPFDYSSMIYITILGYVFFGELPDLTLIGGAVIVIASGLYILHRESRRGIIT